jgi:hypothetical protein
MTKRLLAIVSSLGVLLPALLHGGQAVDLSGSWRFELDRQDAGIDAHWFALALPGSIQLPGSLPSQGVGDPVAVDTKWTGSIFDKSYFTKPQYAAYREPGNIKVPFWLQPGAYYVGAAWFQRDVVIPASWEGRRLVVTLERPHWKTAVWLDGRACGTNDSLSVAHVYDLGCSVPAGPHVLTIRVDNTLVPDIGANSHSVTDHAQGNWNGIVGRIDIAETEPVWIDDLQVFPRIKDRVAIVHGRIGHAEGLKLPATVRLDGGAAGVPAREAVEVPVEADGSFSAEYSMGAGAALWDEFNPALCHVTAYLGNGERRDAVFGLREMGTDGHDFEINGRRLFLRGTLDCAAYPRTGHPPVDVASWEKTFRVLKAHGLNHVRFHSWCPPDEAFVAADELGVYLHVEMSTWPNWSTTLGDGKPVDAWLDAETDRVLKAYGNHPSFAFICSGNEPGAEKGEMIEGGAKFLAGWITRHRAKDGRRLFTSAAGWPELPENDYNVTFRPRIQLWGAGLNSRINGLPPATTSDYSETVMQFKAPIISHEIGQWCAYPNFDEIPKYTGYLKPKNFEIFRASLDAHHMLGQAHDFLMASGKLQAICYKEEIESALRTPHMGGFQLLGLSDFPGQGTAPVGVLDVFWEEKGYISPKEFSRFCNSTVPLARLERRVFTTDEHLTAGIEVAHFGPAPIPRAAASWKLVGDDGKVAASGRFARRDIPIGSGIELGWIDLALRDIPAPARYKLVAGIDGTPFENDWDVWVYPRAESLQEASPPGVAVARSLDADAQERLDAGGTVVLLIPPDSVKPDPATGRIALGFSSIFWNTAWTHYQAPHTLGILCDPRGPAFASFPTDGYTNWQWWYPIAHASAMILDQLPAELRPTVQVVDDWFTNRKLALVFEARVGRGKLLVTSIELGDAALDPVRRQLRSSLLKYAASPAFNPTVALSVDQVLGLTTH